VIIYKKRNIKNLAFLALSYYILVFHQINSSEEAIGMTKSVTEKKCLPHTR
jgi:hypothetical protein